MLLTNESIPIGHQSPFLHAIKVEIGLEDVLLLSDSDEDSVHVVGLRNQYSFHLSLHVYMNLLNILMFLLVLHLPHACHYV